MVLMVRFDGGSPITPQKHHRTHHPPPIPPIYPNLLGWAGLKEVEVPHML